MPRMELYVDLLSQPCRSVYMFAKKNNLDVEIKELSLLNGEHHSEQFAKVNPFKKAPALRDGDFCMAESIPMLEYMCQRFHTPDHWFPADPQKRARVSEYLSWQHMGIRMPGSRMFWMKLMIPVAFKMTVPQDKMAAVEEELNSGLNDIQDKFLQDKPFIGGEQISIADLVAIVEIMQPYAAGHDVFEGRPNLRAWKERVVQEVGKDLFDEAHKKLMAAPEAAKQLDASKMEAFKPRILKMIS